MHRARTFGLWALLCIGGISAFAHLRQRVLEHQQHEIAADSHRQDPMKADFTVPQSARPFPSPAVNPLPHEPLPQELPQPAIAIIIDDLGNQWQYSQRALALHKDITLAILPFSPFGERLAQLAEYHGREVILHAPMEPLAHPAWRDGLRRGMSEQELRHSLANMLDNLPTVRGVNNHMGSALTQERTPMDWVMRELAQRDLYFIDSRTSPGSQALASARQHAIPSARRDVFLDNVRSPDAILAQFNTLVRLAHKRGQAIAIGHPYPETLAVLEQTLPQLGERGVRLVPASHLLDLPTMIETAADRPLQRPAASLSAETDPHQRPKDSTKSI